MKMDLITKGYFLNEAKQLKVATNLSISSEILQFMLAVWLYA